MLRGRGGVCSFTATGGGGVTNYGHNRWRDSRVFIAGTEGSRNVRMGSMCGPEGIEL